MNKDQYESNLMMISSYWRDVYQDYKADQIIPEKKEKVNKNLSESITLLGIARVKIHEVEYVGGDLTVYDLPNIYQELDRLKERLNKVLNAVNKNGVRINLEDYPLK